MSVDRNRLKFYTLLPAALLAAMPAVSAFGADEKPGAEKVTYQDHALPLFRNACLSCHNPDKKKAGLDLSTYAGSLAGGDNGPVINAGDPGGSMLFKVITHAEEPAMPPKKDKLPDKDLEIIRKWIAGGVLETANGKAAIAVKPKVDLGVVKVSVGRPAGPIAMPTVLASDPVVRTQRAGAVPSLAASPWAPLVALGGQKQILLYHSQSLDLIGVLAFPEGTPEVLRFSRNGSVLLAAGGQAAKSGKVVLFDVATGNRITEVGDEFDSVIAADISPDQTVVALGGPGRLVKGYSVADGSLLYTIKKHTDWVTSLAFSPDGLLLASGDRAGNMSVWEAKTGGEFHNLKGHKDWVTDLNFRDDSNILLSASQDGSVALWNMQDGLQAKTWAAHGTAPASGPINPVVGALSAAFAHDGKIVTTGRDKVVKTWDPTGAALKTMEGAFADIALRASFDEAGGRVIAGDWTGQIKVWNAADGKPVGELSLNPPSTAERLETATKKLNEVQAAGEAARVELASAEDALKKAQADAAAVHANIEKTKQAVVEAEARAKSAAATTVTPTPALAPAGDAAAAIQKTEGELAALQAAVDQAKAALEQGEKRLAVANEAVAKNAGDAAAKTELETAQGSVTRRTGRLAEAKKPFDAKAEELKVLRAKGTPAPAPVVAAGTPSPDAKAAQEALAKAKADADAAVKDAAAKTALIAEVTKKVEQAKPAAEQAAGKIAAARIDVTRLKAGQAGGLLAAAKKALSEREGELSAATEAAKVAQGAAEKAVADAAAFEKGIPDAPNRLKTKQQAAEQAKAAAAAAKTAMDAAAAVVQEREPLAAQASDLSAKLAEVAKSAKDNKAITDAAERAKSAAELLASDLAAAKDNAAKVAEASKKSAEAQVALDAAAAKEKSDADNAPKILADLKKAAADAQAAVPKKKQAAEQAAKPVEEAKGKVEQAKGEFERLSKEASAASPATQPVAKG